MVWFAVSVIAIYVWAYLNEWARNKYIKGKFDKWWAD